MLSSKHMGTYVYEYVYGGAPELHTACAASDYQRP